jgi:hypothetical protein
LTGLFLPWKKYVFADTVWKCREDKCNIEKLSLDDAWDEPSSPWKKWLNKQWKRNKKESVIPKAPSF